MHLSSSHYYLLLQVGKSTARGHRAYTQGDCSHVCGAYKSLQPGVVSQIIMECKRLEMSGAWQTAGMKASCLNIHNICTTCEAASGQPTHIDPPAYGIFLLFTNCYTRTYICKCPNFISAYLHAGMNGATE